MSAPRPVAALCVSRSSAYHLLPGVDCFDEARGAYSFRGGKPIVAHPPCRQWSAHCAHQATRRRGEKRLGLWCAEQVRQWGGVLEHPAHSRLWEAAGLPRPGSRPSGDTWAVEVEQAWWGYPMKKATWLFFSKIPPDAITYPFALHSPGGDYRREQLMSKKQRSATTPAFAEWLVAAARLAPACYDPRDL